MTKDLGNGERSCRGFLGKGYQEAWLSKEPITHAVVTEERGWKREEPTELYNISFVT